MKGIASIIVSLVAAVSFTGCGSTSDPAGDSYKALQSFTVDLQQRNYGLACDMYSKEFLGGTYFNGVKTYQPAAKCQITFEIQEANYVEAVGKDVWNSQIKVDPIPVAGTKAKPAPKNGYLYRLKFSQGVVLVGMQRDSQGAWKVVSIDSA